MLMIKIPNNLRREAGVSRFTLHALLFTSYASLFTLYASRSPIANAANLPPAPSSASVPDPNSLLSPDTSSIEEGKALYENGQLIAALGKFMTVLRNDPHNSEARQYLRMIVDTMRQNPALSSSKLGTKEQAVAVNPAVQEEIRKMLQLRSRLTMDLKAIPQVRINVQANINQLSIETPLLFDENSSGLKEQGIPILDRVAAWLKTFGQQPVIIHCYPEEMQDASTNGSLFLRRYSELFDFFTAERKLLPQRFVSADLLHNPSSPLVGEEKGGGESSLQNPPSQPSPTKGEGVRVSSAASRIVIETIGSQAALLDAMPSMNSTHESSRWLESSIASSRKIFNPEEGEWVSLDLAAIVQSGLREWTFKIISAEGKNAAPVFQINGKGNLLKRLSWDGHDQKTGNFVQAGNYVAKLTATSGDGTIKSQEDILKVERTTKEAPVVAQKPKAKAKHHAKAKKPKAKPVEVEKGDSKNPSPLVGEGPVASATRDEGTPHPVASAATPSPTVGEGGKASVPAADDGGDSVHAIWKQVIQFDPNQSEPMPTVKSSLERIGKTLEVYPLQKVRITGFAMTSETNASDLAVKRAETVRMILIEEYHVDARRVIVAGGKTVASENASKVEMSITN